MLLLAGLGNPGPNHEKNRHNIGFMVVDEIVRRHSFGTWRAKFKAMICEGHLGTQKVLAIKPTTFMNESGRSISEAARYYKLTAEQVIVLHDELDLDFGKIRIKNGGGNAGHNGLRSIEKYLDKNYTRVRLGIGHPGDRDRVYGHVLSDFNKLEQMRLTLLIDAIARVATKLANPDQHNIFMTEVTLAVKPQPENRNDKSNNSANNNGV